MLALQEEFANDNISAPVTPIFTFDKNGKVQGNFDTNGNGRLLLNEESIEGRDLRAFKSRFRLRRVI
jgi:hypothetical protein